MSFDGPKIALPRTLAQLGRTTERLSSVYERLSTGQRINRPSDDAAGLALLSGVQNSRRLKVQATRNINDGISALTIAEGAVQQLSSLTERLTELAGQAANGTYSSTQRATLNTEAQALVAEYTRIAKSTTFNGRNLLDGTFSDVQVQVGEGSSANDRIGMSLSNFSAGLGSTTVSVGTGTFSTTISLNNGGFEGGNAVGDLNGDGRNDIVHGGYSNGGGGSAQSYINNGTMSFSSPYAVSGGAAHTSMRLGDFNNDGKLDWAATSVTDLIVALGNGDGTFGAQSNTALTAGVDVVEQNGRLELADFNGDGKLDAAVAGGNGTVSVLLGTGSGTFNPSVGYTAYASGGGVSGISVGDVDGDGTLDIVASSSAGVGLIVGNGNGTFKAPQQFVGSSAGVAIADLNGDGRNDIIASNRAIINNGGGSFTTNAVSYGTSLVSVKALDVNGDGKVDVVSGSSGGGISLVLGNGDGTFGGATAIHGINTVDIALGDLNGDGVTDIVADTPDVFFSYVLYADVTTTTGGVAIDLSTQAGARSAVDGLVAVTTQLGTERAKIGAQLSRFETALSYTQSNAQVLADAESKISSIDVAEEAAELIRLQILQQSQTALQAQSNLVAELVLKLLES